MSPWEEFDDTPNAAGRSRLTRTLNLAKAQKKGLPAGIRLLKSPIIDEYARLDASETHYPNTANVLQSAAQAMNVTLTGVLVDKDKHVESLLRESFPSFRIFCGDWRFPMVRYRSSDAPWLFTMDPYTFSASKGLGDLTSDDLKLVGEHATKTLIHSGVLGAITIFCYSMDDNTRAAFWNATVDALGNYSLEFLSIDATSPGKRHVAAIMSTSSKVTERIVQEVVSSIEGVQGI